MRTYGALISSICAALAAGCQKGHPVSAELQLSRSQEAIWIKADLYPIKAINGQLQNVVVLLQDITAAKLEKMTVVVK